MKNHDQEKKRPLIFLWNYVEWGGAQIYMLAIMKVAKPDWDIVVILPRGSLPEMIGYLEQICVRYEFVDTVLDFGTAPTFKRKIQRQWRRVRAEIVSFRHLLKYDLSESILHVETAPWQSWLFLTAFALRRANVFVTIHNFLPRYSLWRELVWKWRMQYVSRLRRFHIFASNEDTKEQMRGWVTPSFWEQIKVTYTCVNPVEIAEAAAANIDASEIRRRHTLPVDKFLVLSVGQFIDRKGRWVLLDAAKEVIARDPEVAFVWLTPKMPADEEQQRIREYGLDGFFHLVLSETVGKDRQDILRFFRVADIFALPSYVEGLPIALLEAMAMGKASISTRINAIPEAIKHRETGILIEAGDREKLVESILELKNDSKLRERLAKTGRDYVLKHFDEREASRIAIDAYKECFTSAK